MPSMSDDLIELADQYEGNLLNYFCGMSPKESKKFNQLIKNNKRRIQEKRALFEESGGETFEDDYITELMLIDESLVNVLDQTIVNNSDIRI